MDKTNLQEQNLEGALQKLLKNNSVTEITDLLTGAADEKTRINLAIDVDLAKHDFFPKNPVVSTALLLASWYIIGYSLAHLLLNPQGSVIVRDSGEVVRYTLEQSSHGWAWVAMILGIPSVYAVVKGTIEHYKCAIDNVTQLLRDPNIEKRIRDYNYTTQGYVIREDT